MEYSFFDFLKLIGSLGIFIYGMKVMSEGLQNAAGNRLRRILKGMTSNRLSGIFTGFAITCAIQSSSATTVMLVSFVNAGLLSLGESLGVVMGANIGTTLTAWIVAVFGFKVKITSIAIVITGVAFPFLFSKRSNLKYIAEFVLGFCILFIGLDLLKGSVPDLKANPEIFEFLRQYTGLGFASTIIFIGIGTLLTVLVQSSSASTAITLVMLVQGWIDFPIACAMVLGENIGTTITANMAAVIANVHAKRTARFHSIFNIVGVVWMLILFPYFQQLVDFLTNYFSQNNLSVLATDENSRMQAGTIGVALFHSLFNISNVLLFIGFVPFLEKLVIRLQPAKDTDEEFSLKYISLGMLPTPELSIEQAKKEIQEFGRVIDKLCLNVMALIYEKVKNFDKLNQKIKRREEVTDQLEINISNYLSGLAAGDISPSTSRKIKSMLRMINDLERIGDIFFQLMVSAERFRGLDIPFSEEVKAELNDMFDLVYKGIKRMRINLDKESPSRQLIKRIYKMENKLNNMRDKFQQDHYQRIEDGTYSVQEAIIYLDFVNSLEKIGDHLVNINEAIVGIK